MNIAQYILPEILDRCVVAAEYKNTPDWLTIDELFFEIYGSRIDIGPGNDHAIYGYNGYVWDASTFSYVRFAMVTSNKKTTGGYLYFIHPSSYSQPSIKNFWDRLMELWY